MATRTKASAADAELVEKICSSVMPAQQLQPENFWRLVKAYPHREAASIYVYRKWPVIDRVALGRPKYLHIWELGAKPVTEERLKRECGSGKYWLSLVDGNRPRQMQQVARTVVEIDDPEFPPVVDPDELVWEDTANAGYVAGLKAKGVMENKPTDGAAVQNLTALTRELVDRVLSKIESQPGEGAVVDTAIKLEQLVSQARNEGWKGTEALLGMLTKMIEVQMQQAQQKPQSSVTEMRDLLGLLKEVKELTGEGGGAGGSALASFVSSLPASLGSFAQVLREIREFRGGGLGVTGPPAPVKAQNPMPAPQGGSPAGSPGEPPARQTTDGMLEKVTEIATRAVDAFQRGLPGDAFAAGLDSFYPGLYDQVAAAGKEGIMQALKSQPELWAQLEPREAEVERWVDEFLGWGQPEPEQRTERGAEQ